MATASPRTSVLGYVATLGNADEITYAGTYVSRYETLIGYRGPRIPGSTHPCTHTKVVVAPIKVKLTVPNMSTKKEGIIPISAGPGGDARCSVVTASVNYSCSDSEAKATLSELCGDLRPVVSVPNMILELPATLSLWRDLKNPLLRALNLQKRMGHRKRLQHGANALLSQQFGLLPLAGDLTKLLTSARSIHSEVARITARPSSWTGMSKGMPTHNATVSFTHGTCAIASVVKQEASTQVTARLHYQTRSTRKFTDPVELTRKVARALYGFDNPMSVLWEATPYSFVIDWFLPIGDYIKGLDKTSFGDSMEVRRLCTCVKATHNVTMGASWGGSAVKSCANVYASIFKRYNGLPTSSVSLSDISVPGVSQSILGGALVLQKMK